MACPTCDHTMEKISDGNGGVFWCRRCGTIKSNVTFVDRPMLVDRCRKFGGTLGPAWSRIWNRLCIAESINLPTDRQQPGKD